MLTSERPNRVKELFSRGMLGPRGWGFYSHDQLMTILRGVFPDDEARWQVFRAAVELHLFRERSR